MKNSLCLKNILLILEVFLLCGAVLLIRTFFPGAFLPRIDLPMLTVLSVIPMIMSGFVLKRNQRPAMNDEACLDDGQDRGQWLFSLLLAGATFTFLPLAADWSAGLPLWKMFVAGTVVFGITDVIYTSMLERISSGNRAPLVLFTNGILLWLASQCFQAML